jgi:lipopolysaccharide biosynthesis glycosyltransferase
MKSSRVYITGCDRATEWQLPWFVSNFKKHNPGEELLVFNFDSKPLDYSGPTVQLEQDNTTKWFKKPAAMLKASTMAKNVLWLDTDCEVLQRLNKVFDKTEENKLALVEDRPWSKRRGVKWYNTGVVAFRNRPNILDAWHAACSGMKYASEAPLYGDQDVLHAILKDPLKRMIHITDLPHEYNTLRLDFVDEIAPKDPKVIHHTGRLGKEKIRELMRNG